MPNLSIALMTSCVLGRAAVERCLNSNPFSALWPTCTSLKSTYADCPALSSSAPNHRPHTNKNNGFAGLHPCKLESYSFSRPPPNKPNDILSRYETTARIMKRISRAGERMLPRCFAWGCKTPWNACQPSMISRINFNNPPKWRHSSRIEPRRLTNLYQRHLFSS